MKLNFQINAAYMMDRVRGRDVADVRGMPELKDLAALAERGTARTMPEKVFSMAEDATRAFGAPMAMRIIRQALRTSLTPEADPLVQGSPSLRVTTLVTEIAHQAQSALAAPEKKVAALKKILRGLRNDSAFLIPSRHNPAASRRDYAWPPQSVPYRSALAQRQMARRLRIGNQAAGLTLR